ncbi:ROK family transcriptional regulator [Kitasatospora sp. MMS16-BH015]|uniref:ROK family transcriptional regulator n=1 Tax=Kitasatospora sp. MMS16-BH015 TaxID=2018025 RepID=UPI000CA0A690|nr:ROK family transcriptional regulator [Kitasatospora sp. MMS16-BH015]AUG75850.1 ROK family transcriptional regulator [Kitasatospora sp. MMS16-BH015]
MFPNHAQPLVSAPAETAVLALLLAEGPLSRVELARRAGLSSTAVTKAARPLIEDGYLHELPPERTAPGAGRPVNPLAVTADREYFAGVKISAEALYGTVCDLRAGVRATAERRLGADRGPAAVCALLHELVDELLGSAPEFRERTRHLGIAVSGDVDRPAGRVRYSVLPGWQDVPVAETVARATGLSVTVENDVKALTVAEHWFGEGIGTEYFALVTIGAGIGSGLVVGGQLVSGAYGVAGEMGHLSIDPAGPRCHCGQTGCVEAIASSDAIRDAVRRAGGDPELDFDGAVLLARAGEPAARAAFARAGQAIGTGIATLVNLLGPERVVVTGEGLDTYDLFGVHIREAYAAHCFKAAAACPLTLRPLPWEEWARGAAVLGIQALFP